MDAGEQHRLDFAAREVVLRANLDEADEERCIWASVRFIMSGPRHPRVGESVLLVDRRGGVCTGRVEELNGWLARVRLLPDQG